MIRRCLDGQPEAWEAFHREFSPYLSTVLRAVLQRSGAEAEPAAVQDLLQETFAVLLENRMAVLRRFKPKVPLKHYLATIATYRCIRWLDRHRKEALRQSPALQERLRNDLLEGTKADPASRLEAWESGDRVDRALSKLSDKDRLLLRLFYWNGLPAERLAELAEVQADSIWTLLARARDRLADILKRSALLF